MRIVLAPYNPEWPDMFAAERDRLRAPLGPEIRIEHIGSTAVPGLAAKPVIDIMAGLPDFSGADALVPGVVALGYRHIREYEAAMPFRRFFTRDQNGARAFHVHMVQAGGEFWERHLLFRDFLRSHPDTAREYAGMKAGFAEREWENGNAYAEAKTPFIREMERRARSADLRFAGERK